MFGTSTEDQFVEYLTGLEAMLQPYTNHIFKRMVIAAVIVLACTLLQRFLMLFWPENRLRVEVCEIDYDKRHHWQLFSIVLGFFILPGTAEPVCTLPMLIRHFIGSGMHWEVILYFLTIMFIPALYRSIQYLRYFGPICPLDIWLDYLKHMGYGIFLYQCFEGVFRLFFAIVGNTSNGWIRFFFQICLCAQAFIPVKILLKAIEYFGSSFFTRATREELNKKYWVEQARKSSIEGPEDNESGREDKDDDASGKKSVFPTSIQDPYGNVYWLQYDGGNIARYDCISNGNSVSFFEDDVSEGLPSGWYKNS